MRIFTRSRLILRAREALQALAISWCHPLYALVQTDVRAGRGSGSSEFGTEYRTLLTYCLYTLARQSKLLYYLLLSIVPLIFVAIKIGHNRHFCVLK